MFKHRTISSIDETRTSRNPRSRPMHDTDPFDLDRFVSAQAGSWPTALAELAAGEKRGHWIWFVFPQIAGLARSETARFYAIGSPAEGRAYLTHPVLGPRLIEATNALLGHSGRDVERMLGTVDAMKLRSSLTLFLLLGAGSPFDVALRTFYDGKADPLTLAILTDLAHESIPSPRP